MVLRTLCTLTLIALSWSSMRGSADAQSPLPFASPTSLGPRGTAAQVSVSVEGEETVIALTVGRRRAESRLRGASASASVESVSSSAGRVALVRTDGPVRLAALFVLSGAAPTLAWSGRLDWHGDGGERWADTIEIADRTGDGVADVVVGVVREGVTRCDTPAPILLSPRALTPTGTLRSVELRRGLDSDRVAMRAQTVAGPRPEPVLRALRFVGASSTAGSDDVLSASPPRALTDGDGATGWSEGRPGDGAGEVLSARWEADVPLTALRFRGTTMPRSISLFVGDAWAERIELDPAGHDLLVRLTEPVSARCISVVIDEGVADGATGFAEISAYTAYDEGEGLGALVDELVAEGEHGDDVATWMGRLGDPAAAALDAAWDRLSMLGRLRAMRVAGALRSAAGAELLYRGSGDESEEVRDEALRRMAASGAYDALARRALTDDAAGEDAALSLAAAENAAVSEPAIVFAALAEGRGRVGLRLAAGRIAGRDEAAARSFAETGSPSALSALALGLVDERLGARGRPGRLGLAGTIVEAALARASNPDFEDRYRLALAARAIPRSAAIDAWLSTQATGAEEWMQRALALEALSTDASPEVLAHALGDGYPRVRIAAVAVASEARARDALIAASSDGWPQVRASAVRALNDAPTALAALGDDVALVRVAAIEVLTALGDRTALERIEERLTDRDEWPEVVRAGLRYIQSLCLAEGAAAIAQVVRRGARDGAWAPDVELAIDALGVAFRLGGEAADRAREAATSGGASVAAFEPALSREASFERCVP